MGIMSDNKPTIYAYRVFKPDRFWYIKVGYTEKNPQVVIFEETEWASLTPDIIMVDSAEKEDGGILTSVEFHEYLRQQGYKELESGIDHCGWFRCEPEDIIAAYKHLIGS